jgi:hypothetical protein
MVMIPKQVTIAASHTEPKCFRARFDGMSERIYYSSRKQPDGFAKLLNMYKDVEDCQRDVVVKAHHAEIFLDSCYSSY